MEKTDAGLPELIFGTSDKKETLLISKLLKGGFIKKIAPRIYTSNLEENPENIISRNILFILGKLHPGALLSHRSAIEFKPTDLGHIFVTHSYTKKIRLPGIIVRFIEGKGPQPGDIKLNGLLYSSSLERALLENMQQSRKKGNESKTLSKKEIRQILENIGRTNGDEQLNILRFKAGAAADALGLNKEYIKLDKILNRILAKKISQAVKSPLAAAKVFGEPYEPTFISSLEALFRDLSLNLNNDIPEKNSSMQAFRNFAFFESYFSAAIENEWIYLDSAKEIIFNHLPVYDADYAEFKGLYDLAADWKEMKIIPASPDEFVESLRYRHSLIYRGATDKKPGLFRENTPAGWIDCLKVTGSLKKAFTYNQGLPSAFARAACTHFIINAIKPFHYGNGIIARLMMNAEMVAANQSKILIPPVYKEDYVRSTENISDGVSRGLFINTLRKALDFSSNIFGNDLEKMQADLGLNVQ